MQKQAHAIGYTRVEPSLSVDSVLMLKTEPPQCMVTFYTPVHHEGHAMSIVHELDVPTRTAHVYVTLHVKREGPHRPSRLAGAANLGALAPGQWLVVLHFRRDEPGRGEAPYLRDAAIVVEAQDNEELARWSERGREWHAWYDLPPPQLGRTQLLHVSGELVLPSRAFTASLRRADPPGPSPSVLLLDVEIARRRRGATDGPEHVVELRYHERDAGYTGVLIRFPDGSSADIPQIDVCY